MAPQLARRGSLTLFTIRRATLVGFGVAVCLVVPVKTRLSPLRRTTWCARRWPAVLTMATLYTTATLYIIIDGYTYYGYAQDHLVRRWLALRRRRGREFSRIIPCPAEVRAPLEIKPADVLRVVSRRRDD